MPPWILPTRFPTNWICKSTTAAATSNATRWRPPAKNEPREDSFPGCCAYSVLSAMVSFSTPMWMEEIGFSKEAMIASLEKSPPVRVPGTAVYMSRAINVIPFALMHNLKHNKVLHERVILLTLRTEDAPYVHNVRRVQIEQLSPTFWRVVASYGWRETPNVEEVFHRCGLEGLSCRMMETSFFMSHESLILGKRPWYLRLRGKLYLLLQRNALRAPDQFEIPPNRVIELGTQVEI